MLSLDRSAGAALAAVLLAPLLSAQTPRVIYTAPGDGPGDQLGFATASCGDIDGDGHPDLIVGAPFADDLAPDAGTARILGRNGQVLLTLRGDQADDHFGSSVAGLGDVDGDGVPDVIVGAPHADHGGTDSGRARVFSGRDGRVLFTIDGAPGDECGYAVGAAGDLDRDGHADFIVGFHLADTPGIDAGRARVYSGRDGSILFDLVGAVAGDHFGAWVGEVGDVNADGWTDFAVGAPWADVGFIKSGSLYVYSGRDGSVLHLLHGEGGGHEFGVPFAKCGDIDGDGHADLLVGEPEHKLNGDDAGAVKLFSGRTGALLLRLHGFAPYQYFGLALSAGDLDADGVPDLIVGAFLEATGAPKGGAVHVYSGATFAPMFSVYGTTSIEELGRSVAFAGDLDGDGIGDLAVGIPRLDLGGTDAGGVRTYSGVPAAPATFVYGTGCPAAQPFALSFSGQPRAGQPFQIHLANGPTAVPVAMLALALRDHPPIDLTPVGMTGCSLYQPLDLLIPLTLTGGSGTLPLQAPFLGAASGLQLFLQGIGWDPGINPLGVVTTNGGRIVVAR